jgi:hypothetical protein
MDLKREAIWIDGDRELAAPGRMLPTCRPASIFVFLSLAFGSIIIFANPPLRGITTMGDRSVGRHRGLAPFGGA